MKVKDIVISALEIIGRSELAKSLAGGEELSAGDSETVNTLLYCFNATEDELARKYMPLSYKEEITSQNGRFYFAAFVHAPVKLKSVTSDGESVSYEIFPEYLKADARKTFIIRTRSSNPYRSFCSKSILSPFRRQSQTRSDASFPFASTVCGGQSAPKRPAPRRVKTDFPMPRSRPRNCLSCEYA